MKKIPSVFARNYDGDRLVRDEVVPGCEWVLAGEGTPTIKWDGTAAMVGEAGQLWRRYDRKPSKAARRRGKPYQGAEDFKPAPSGWSPAEPAPNVHTGHWPGWLPVGDGPEDRWFREALEGGAPPAGTYELVGPKVQGNPHRFPCHRLVGHGWGNVDGDPRTFDAIREHLRTLSYEGIVWHHPDGRMAKIKRRDFGFEWPLSVASVLS